MPRRFGFSRWERIRKSSEYGRVLKGGKRIVTPHFAVYVLKKDDPIRRIGISVSKRVGKSTVRNRIKRLLREAFRLNKGKLEEGLDVVVIVRNVEGIRKMQDVEEELMGALSQWVRE